MPQLTLSKGEAVFATELLDFSAGISDGGKDPLSPKDHYAVLVGKTIHSHTVHN